MKNKFNTQKIWSTLLLMLMGLMTISCNRDDEASTLDTLQSFELNKWGKVEIILREGHAHGGAEIHSNPFRVGTKMFPAEQKITFEQKPSGLEIKRENRYVRDLANYEEEDEPRYEFYYEQLDSKAPFEVMSSSKQAVGYAMEIIYYNPNGEKINSQFFSPYALAAYQHFFLTQRYFDLNTGNLAGEKGNKEGYFDNLYDYHYRDTKSDVKYKSADDLLGVNLGLKGNFFFKQELVKFDMTIKLSQIVGKDNKIPGNNPNIELKDTNFEQNISFVVVESLDKYSSTNRREFITNVKKYYNLTMNNAAFERYFNRIKATPPEGGHIPY